MYIKFLLLVFCYVSLCVDCVYGLLGCQQPKNNTTHLSYLIIHTARKLLVVVWRNILCSLN